jgi:hypothetical protein
MSGGFLIECMAPGMPVEAPLRNGTASSAKV